jgi:hypothetical protein
MSRWLSSFIAAAFLGLGLSAPVAAQPAADVGGMSVIAAPAPALAEMRAAALDTFNITTMAFIYRESANRFGDYLIENCDSFVLLEGAEANMALLRELWTTGATSLPSVTARSTDDLAGIFIGMGADPDKPVTVETVAALAAMAGIDPGALDLPLIARNAAMVQNSLAEARAMSAST